METNEKLNEVLNDLIKINHDREQGYEKAISQLSLHDSELKAMFSRYARESRQFADVLAAEVAANGGKPATATTMSGKIYRTWMDLKTSMSNKENQSVLESCEFGEDAAQRAYEDALQSNAKMTPGIRDIITRQKAVLKAAHDEVKHERDMHLAHH